VDIRPGARGVKQAQLDLFAWAKPRQGVRRIGWRNLRVDCVIGPHWWFSEYLCIPCEGVIVPDLKSPITWQHYQFRG